MTFAPEPPGGSTGFSEDLTRALVAELAKKTGVCWLQVDGHTQPVWHVWSDGALCLVSGGAEQPLPDLAERDRVGVVMRSKDTGGRLLTWSGEVSVVRPEDDAWAPTTTALAAGRLNLRDPATAADDWARQSTVLRITPA